ncbi:MAG: type II toxin-antitoxin system ParD family antitoxin [Alphaproteobacteria bacterium]|nr:MAG: type II toxin-antitoxin system ParD family antitoxin [Alphaproteobacteria bacterium]
MNKPTNIQLPEHQAKFAEGQVAEGHYGSVSEVVQAALRLLEEQEAQLSQLRDALVEGEQSGPARPFDAEAFLSKLQARRAAGP